MTTFANGMTAKVYDKDFNEIPMDLTKVTIVDARDESLAEQLDRKERERHQAFPVRPRIVR